MINNFENVHGHNVLKNTYFEFDVLRLEFFQFLGWLFI